MRRVPVGRWAVAAAYGVALLAILPIAGCGGGNPVGKGSALGGATDVDRIRRAAGSLNSGMGAWKSAFAEGAAPTGAIKDRFLECSFVTGEGKVEVDGDTATLEVGIRDSSGKDLGNVQWKLKKQADGLWKITEASLPGG